MHKGIALPLIIIASVAIGGIAYLYGGEAFRQPISKQAPTKEVVNSNFSVLVQGQDAAGVDQRVNYRITDSQQFSTLWRMIYGAADPVVPSVDFSKKEVLAVFDGSHSTSGYGIAVTDLKEVEGKRVLYVTHIEPGDSCSPQSVYTSPFAILVVDKSPLPLAHEEQVEVSHCQ
jgi:hypothetical protein